MISRHRVLLVDEDVERIARASVLVDRFGHEVRAIRCEGFIAEHAATFAPDLVITDAVRGALLFDVLAEGNPPPLLVAGIGNQTGANPFDCMLAWPLRPSALLQLLWRVEVLRTSRGRSGTGPRIGARR